MAPVARAARLEVRLSRFAPAFRLGQAKRPRSKLPMKDCIAAGAQGQLARCARAPSKCSHFMHLCFSAWRTTHPN
eukprot:scaffold1786_cov250-Pinguiococcus_pyrenoidosus.AAC.11